MGAMKRILLIPVLGVILTAGNCPNNVITIPPAETPELVSTGLEITGASGQTTTIGEFDVFCRGDYTLSEGPFGRGAYVTVRMPTLNTPEVSYAGAVGDYWGALTNPAEQALTQGPRPLTPQQEQSLAGNYVGYFIHDDRLVGNEYHVTVGILLGQQTPVSGALEIRSVNDGANNTGTDRRSDPLSLVLAAPVSLSATVTPTTANENSTITVSWTAQNADSVELTGPGIAATNAPTSGNRAATLACVGDRDSRQVTFGVTARRDNCVSDRSAREVLPVTVRSTRRIDTFRGLPRFPRENTAFELDWNAPGANSISISGPNNFSHSSSQAADRVSVTAPGVPRCLQTANFNYSLSASWPGSCGPRTDTALVTVTTAVQTFRLIESGGAQCRGANHVCLAQGRDAQEAIDCNTCAIQQGCSWQEG